MTKLVANWSYPTAVRFGAGRIAELAEACSAPASCSRCSSPMPASPSSTSPRARSTSCEKAALTAGALLRCEAQPGRDEPHRRRRGVSRPAAMTASSPSAAAAASTPASSSPSWPGRRGRSGISRISATGGRAPTPDAIAPIVAVPTTAGTGSEVGRAGVVTDEKTHTKKIIFHPKMMPKVVIAIRS